jgi:putative nucleotidyltransferase with HDIG domain
MHIQAEYRSLIDSIPVFDAVRKAASAMEVYVVGGFVRDHLLGRPSVDIDIVCVGSGIALARKTALLLGGNSRLSVYKNFGTAQLLYGDYNVEFVGARKESYRSDSRKPVVEDGTLEEDQKRRDFTINALAIGLTGDTYGRLVDPFDGVRDLEQKIIRTPLDPERTFSDDPLRIMRAVRFASQLGFDIDHDTFQAIAKMKSRLQIVSQERTTEELNKIIMSPVPSYGFKLLFHSGLLEVILPEMLALRGVENRKGKGHKDNFYHTLQVLDNVARVSDSLWLRWAAILHDIAKPRTKRFDKKSGWTFHGHEELGARMVPGIFKRLKLPLHDKMKYVQKLVRLHLRPIALVSDEITDSALRRLLFEAGDDVDDLMKLCKADITSKNIEKVARYLQNFAKVEQKLQEVEEHDRIRNFQPPVRGEDIMEYFGIPPSRTIGEIKEEIKEAILEGKISNNRDEAFAFMREIGKQKGLHKNT